MLHLFGRSTLWRLLAKLSFLYLRFFYNHIFIVLRYTTNSAITFQCYNILYLPFLNISAIRAANYNNKGTFRSSPHYI